MMTNLEKMNQLVGANVNEEQVKHWAYNNRITVDCLHFEEEFESMEKSVDKFINSELYSVDEFKNWDEFLRMNYID